MSDEVIKFLKVGLVLALVFLLPYQTYSQNSKSQNSKSTESRTILLDGKKPAVYLEFVKTGRCFKDLSIANRGDLCTSTAKTARAFDAFWVRLVNNTRWAVGVTVEKAPTDVNSTAVTVDSTAFVDEDGETKYFGKMVAHNGAEMDVVYKAESETGCDFSEKAPPGERCKRMETIVPEIPLPAISTDIFVASGESVIFPVDIKHIKKYVNLYVLYNFQWEYSGQFLFPTPAYEMQHRAYFNWSALEKGIEQEAEKRQKKNVF